jgi:hypothetical protein
MNLALPHQMDVMPGASDWMQDRLSEARDILLDAPRPPDTLVILAARECADAVDLWRQLDRRPLHVIAAAAFPNGGAA